ncbi:MAG: PD40 domain-containing protein [Undibacterium sp.]|nr:PD40 domain-containing protein [Opitutaceae bacterium]
MKKILRLAMLLLTLTEVPLQAQRDIGSVEVLAENKTVPVRVSANTPELNALALQAFGSHGRYRLVATGFAFDIKFSAVTPTQVRVDITKSPSGTAVATEVVTGATARNALLRAADVAVVKTNGLGLRGFFASKLAFINERTGKKEIYTGDLLFGEVKQITRDNSIILSPRWAPDGSRLLYTSFYKSGFPDIFTIDLGSYQRSTFVSFKGTNSGARFSPNGSQVAMILSGEGTPEIYVSNAQGRGVARKTRSDTVKSSPCFSPDGTRLVYAGEPGPQLYTMPVNGGSPTRLTSGISSYCAEPDWSKTNPNKIAFTIRVGRNFQIAVYDFTKRASEQVSKAKFDGVEPNWLPDGRHVVYTARDSATSRVCILDTETGKSTPISPASFGSTLQANVWAP